MLGVSVAFQRLALRGRKFFIESLFRNAEEGTFLDFTTSQVYADTAGTDPAEVGEGIALTLDKSQGANDVRRNLLTYTEEFDNAVWLKTRGTITQSVQSTPDGDQTVGVFTATDNDARLDQVSTIADINEVNIATVWVKSADGPPVEGQIDNGGLNISAFTATSEWQKVLSVYGTTGVAQPRMRVRITSSGGSIYVWHPQLELGSTATPYQKITTGINGEWTPGTHSTQATSTARPIFARVPVGGRRNLLTHTEDFSNAAWGKINGASVLGETVTALTTGVFRYVVQNISVASGAEHSVSGEFKPGTSDFVWLLGQTSADAFALFNVSSGEYVGFFGGGGAPSAQSIVAAGDGWYRCSATWTKTTAAGLEQGGFGLSDGVDSSVTAGASIQARKLQFELGSLTPCQKVVTQYDITESGVPSVYHSVWDKSDDILPITLPAITGGTVALVGLSGIWIEDNWDYAGGTLDIGPTTIAGLPAGILDVVGDLCAVIINDRAWTAAERAGVVAWGKARGAPGVFGLGPELVTNGTFDTDTAWAKGAGWSISGGAATHTGATAGNLTQSGLVLAGEKYALQWSQSGGFIATYVGSLAFLILNTGAAGTYDRMVTAGATGDLIFRSNDESSVDNVSLRRYELIP